MPEVKTYQQADEPSDLTPGTTWLNDNGKAYIRKVDLSWNYIGEWQLPNMHHLHVEGGTVLGPILGAHGLMPANNPSMTGTATLNDIELADKQWSTEQLGQLRQTLENYISGSVVDGVASSNLTLGSSIAFGFGTIGHDGVVPLPKYHGDVTAKLTDVVLLLVSPYDQDHWNSSSVGYWVKSICKVDPSTLRVECYTVDYMNQNGGDNKYRAGLAQYVIACMKKS